MTDYPPARGVLKSLREVRNLDLEEASELIGIDVAHLNDLEEGVRHPNLGLLRKIANKYQFPLATLAHPNPLEPREPVTDFRTIEGGPARLGLALSIAVDEARQIQSFAAELVEQDADLYAEPDLPVGSTEDDPATLAAAERRRLGFTEAIQANARDAADAFNFLRTRIEGLGVFVYLVKVPLDECRGFCLVDDRPPLVAVNDEEAFAGPKLFTLLHEYCHVLLRAPGISGTELRNPTERFCNVFAANFLMPAEMVSRVMPDADGPVEWDRQTVANAARSLRVSQQALALRLEELRHAPPGFYDRWNAALEGASIPRATSAGFVPWERRVLRKFGTGYAGLVLRALDKGNISRLDAYRLLKVKPVHLDALSGELAGRRDRVGATGA